MCFCDRSVNGIGTVENIASVLDDFVAGDFQERWNLAKTLSDLGEPILAPLIQRLNQASEDLELQWFGARVLGNIPHPESVLQLVRLLEESEDEDVQSVAAEMLAGFGEQAIAILQPYLDQSTTREIALRALRQIDHPDVVPLLLPLAGQGTVSQQVLILEILERHSHPDVVSVLMEALQSPAVAIRSMAIAALSFQTEHCAADVLVQKITPALRDLDGEVVRQAARGLGRLGTAAAAIALVDYCRGLHVDLALLQDCVQALGWIDAPEAVAGLSQLCGDWVSQVPLPEGLLHEAIAALGRVQGEANHRVALQMLLMLLDSEALVAFEHLQSDVALALGQLGERDAVPSLIEHLSSKCDGLHWHVMAALKRLLPEGTQQLQQYVGISEREPKMAQGLAIALQEW
jgi:HEAT repeat protein